MKVVAPRGRLPDCAIGSALFECIHLPYHHEGQRTGAFRFGDSRAMALAGAMQLVLNAVTGFTNKRLRAHVAGLPGHNYTQSQMSYDLRRLHLHGLIERLPPSNTYVLTPTGSASPSSTPSSKTGSCARSWTPTSHPRASTSAARSRRWKPRSTTTSPTPVSPPRSKTRHNVTTSGPQVELVERAPGSDPPATAFEGAGAPRSPTSRAASTSAGPFGSRSSWASSSRPSTSST